MYYVYEANVFNLCNIMHHITTSMMSPRQLSSFVGERRIQIYHDDRFIEFSMTQDDCPRLICSVVYNITCL
jgi:hypothetical protein